MAGTTQGTAAGVAIYDRWAALWSGTAAVDELMAPRFTLRYAQVGAEHFNDIRDRPALAAAVAEFRAARPGIFYTPEGPAVVEMDDVGTGFVARPYLATIPGAGGVGGVDGVEPVRVSGTDILRCERGAVVEVWSVSARGIPFYPRPGTPGDLDE